MDDQKVPINGRLPRNSQYSGGLFPSEKLSEYLVSKYPNGVIFSQQGFPDFSPYAYFEVQIGGLTGKGDDLYANRALGLTSTPDGYTWHHVEDGKTMQLVPSDLHDKVAHTGGRAYINQSKANPDLKPPPAARDSLMQQAYHTQYNLLPDNHPLKAIDHHASRGVGVAGVAVDVASGNYTSAAVGAVMEVAQDDRVQKTMIETALEQSGNVARVFGQAAKRTPLVGTVVTGGYVLYEAGGYALDGEWGKAAAATTAGLAEAGGNIVGFGVGDAAREMVRGGIIATAGDEYAVEKSGLRQLGEAAIDVGGQMLSGTAPKGVPLQEVLPQNYREMTQGADEMGERSDVKRIAVERTGLAANDAGNSLERLAADPQSPKAHILILADGSVQGPADGGVPFEHNPRIAAGRNSETLGVLYAGEGAMNDAQYRTVLQLQGWLSEQRQGHGVPSSSAPLFAGSYDTAALLKLPTPKQAELGMTSTPTTTPPRYNASFNAAAMG